jgi:hypothetical protein
MVLLYYFPVYSIIVKLPHAEKISGKVRGNGNVITDIRIEDRSRLKIQKVKTGKMEK